MTNQEREVPQVDATTFLKQLDPEIYPLLLNSLRVYSDAIGMVYYSNHDLSSPYVGEAFAICFGPSNTLQQPEYRNRLRTSRGHHWQYFAENWCDRESLIQELDKK